MFTLKYDLSQPELSASYLRIAKKASYSFFLPPTVISAILLFTMFTMTSMLTSSSRFLFLIVYSIILLYFSSCLLVLISLPSQHRNMLANAKPQQITFLNDEYVSQSDSAETTYSYQFFNRFRINDQWLILNVRQNYQKHVAKIHPRNQSRITSLLIPLHSLSAEEIDDLSRFLANRIHR